MSDTLSLLLHPVDFSPDNNIEKSSRVGIFFYHDGNVFFRSITVGDGCKIGPFIGSDFDHHDYWGMLLSEHDIPKSVKYDFVPRGRVLFDTQSASYIIFLSLEFINNNDINIMIKEYFNLRGEIVNFEYDDYYKVGPRTLHNSKYIKRLLSEELTEL